MKILLFYFGCLFFIALRDFFKVKKYDDFVVAGRSQSLPWVTFSLLATILGASATLGVCGRAEVEGYSAFWWLGFGALGIWLQAFLLSKKIRGFSVSTLPELIKKTVGPRGARLVALVIAVSWVGVVGAQFVGLGYFLNILIEGHSELLILISACLVILYTLLGGQKSVVKTDSLQILLFTMGILGTFFFLFFFSDFENVKPRGMPPLEFFGNDHGVVEWVSLGLTVLGVYLLGPDIVSRNLLSKSPQVAKNANLIAGFLLVFFGVIITLIGVWSGIFFPGENNPLIRLAENALPLPLGICLCIGIISALFSSADTSLMNGASIFSQDLLGSKKISVVRVVVLVMGLLSVALALRGEDIISLLFSAYSVYTPGVVCPLVVAILVYGKYRIVEKIWLIAVILGGMFGLIATILKEEMGIWPLIGMVVSLLISLASLRRL